MENKQLPSITLSIDTKRYQVMINTELDKQARDAVNEHINFLFINPTMEQERYSYLKDRTNDHPDLGAGNKFIKEIIDKRMLEDKFQDYVNNYIERNFPRLLDEALEKALSHKAHAMAFKASKARLTVDGANKEALSPTT